MCQRCLSEPEAFQPEVYCRRCRTPYLNSRPLDDDGVCLACVLGHNRYDTAYSFGSYEGTLRDLIHLFKYEGVQTLARPLGRMILRSFPREARFDAIVPMPLHWTKRIARGYNQSRLLALELSRGTGLPVERLVRRRRATPSQAGLRGRDRRANVRGAFAVLSADRVAGRRLLLIDDVLTTGSTLNACAAVLKSAGAAHVSVLTLVRADRRHWPTARLESWKPVLSEAGVSG